MVANTTASRKAKGRKLQQWVRDKLLDIFPSLEQDDVRSTGMGQRGEDVQLSPKARGLFNYSVECKRTERISLYPSYEQACTHARGQPLLIVKSNNKPTLAIVEANYFIELHKEKHDDS